MRLIFLRVLINVIQRFSTPMAPSYSFFAVFGGLHWLVSFPQPFRTILLASITSRIGSAKKLIISSSIFVFTSAILFICSFLPFSHHLCVTRFLRTCLPSPILRTQLLTRFIQLISWMNLVSSWMDWAYRIIGDHHLITYVCPTESYKKIQAALNGRTLFKNWQFLHTFLAYR